MNNNLTHPTLTLLVAGFTQLAAAEGSVGIVPQIMVGTAGMEIGLAVEVRSPRWQELNLRPELFLNNDERVGGGLSVLWAFSDWFNFPDRHDFAIGPRVVHHNTEDEGLDASALGIWSIALGDVVDRRHAIEVLAAVGVLQDREEDDADPSLSVGAAYAYRF